jgi:hypothetical protein
MNTAAVAARAPIHFPAAPIHTHDGVRALQANLCATIRMLDAAHTATTAIEVAAAKLWYDLARSQESRPRHGHYTTILPRLLRIPRDKDKTALYSGRLVLHLSNPKYTPCVTGFDFDAPAPRQECTATLSIIDLTPVKNIPSQPNPNAAPHTHTPTHTPQDLATYIRWAVNEFNTTFFVDAATTAAAAAAQPQRA